MIFFLLGVLLLDESKGAQYRLSDNILYHELVGYDTEHIENQHSRHKRDLSSFLTVTFPAFNQIFNLKLSKNDDVFTDDVTFTSNNGDVHYDFYSLVKGHVNEDRTSYAHGSIHDGIFEGVVRLDNETYHVEKSAKYYDNPKKHSLIYRFSDVRIDPTQKTCGVKDSDHLSSDYKIFGETPHVIYDNKKKYFHDIKSGGGDRRKRSIPDIDKLPTKYCTLYMGADYKFFKQHSNNFAPAIISKLGTYVEQVNEIYYNTLFPGFNYRIKFLINRVHVYEDEKNKYDSAEYAAARFLDLTSTRDSVLTPDEYCLAYMFTHRDFEGGVLGLAFRADHTSDSAGLCAKCRTYTQSRCVNTGIVTTKNVKEVPALQSYLTFGHELGHNFGSPHDTDSCAPGNANGGNYLMFAFANTGNNINNKMLSSCSKKMMGPIMSIQGTCFLDNQNVCGNFVKNGVEECDCGDETTCAADNCCNSKTCKFKKTDYQCSKLDGVCCNTEPNTCKPYTDATKASGIECAPETQCRKSIKCKTTTFQCQVDVTDNKPDDTLCNGGTQVCKSGQCQDSLCVFEGAKSCQCLDKGNECNLCCEKEIDGVKQCINANNTDHFSNIAKYLNATTSKLSPGSVCGGDMGYCDIFYICRIVDADGPIASLGNYIFNGVLFDEAQNIFKEYWYYVIMMGIGLLCFMVAFIAVCSKTVKPPKIPRGGERMSYPVTYKNMVDAGRSDIELVRHR